MDGKTLLNLPLSLNSISASLTIYLRAFLSTPFFIMLDAADEENPLEVSIWLRLRSFLLMLLADDVSRLCDDAMLALVVVLCPP
jgi:hypothetical protein